MKGIFRIDDVSANTDTDALFAMMKVVRDRLPSFAIMLAVSPLVHDMSDEPAVDQQRAFPRILSAQSDHRNFFNVKKALATPIVDRVMMASHGLVHVDHRLLGREAQEMSILTSCSLVGARVFVPPFNKYNQDTIDLCDKHEIDLVKFEEGWKHVGYNSFSREPSKVTGCVHYYCHTHDANAASISKWLDEGGVA